MRGHTFARVRACRYCAAIFCTPFYLMEFYVNQPVRFAFFFFSSGQECFGVGNLVGDVLSFRGRGGRQLLSIKTPGWVILPLCIHRTLHKELCASAGGAHLV
ncbi:hypothetical protein, unlikely [Trypanosoma brucei gambiense DAL972]|uniref:Uncharacterized protein n=1 Tax=Trypanosoma brucei gambiense (strain MHOM/CI/86/DAL972) TaxID=679716 RepID=C9ZLI7_TRYB9|nr:hypothetical protein, unlikely [Trypanosoma brucei gambiense DAL972]CBH10196.1 hypothetical protein, unlikely [Trypanosoma brucei gambiense DAL972]|eukprot:XP_011772486.1 hypothetical protein, unlikely [Trypanosoma brucei gambiense DAL972]